MNYEQHYNRLIDRARIRVITEYTESHHIVPRCMGGPDDSVNLVELTPEEHFVAHQLLIKMYPNNHRLVLAASMMCVANSGQMRNNKCYGWVRRQMSAAMSVLQSGELNSQYGTIWMHHLQLKLSKKIRIDEKDNAIATGWITGRKLNFIEKYSICCTCGKTFSGKRKTCNEICKRKGISNRRKLSSPLHGREKEFLDLYSALGSMNAALKQMGFPGATSHYYDNAKKILRQLGIGAMVA